MPDVRVAQDVVETLSLTNVPVRVAQDVVEVLSPTTISARVSQDVVETLAKIQVPVRVAQDIVELLIPGVPDVSGVYFINTSKAQRHDSYYGDRTDPLNPGPGLELKIPDPRIRTALIGE